MRLQQPPIPWEAWDARDVGPSLAGMLLRFIIAASILPTVKGVLDSS